MPLILVTTLFLDAAGACAASSTSSLPDWKVWLPLTVLNCDDLRTLLCWVGAFALVASG